MANVFVVSSSSWSEAFHFVPKDEHLVMFLQNRLGVPVPAGIPGITIRDVDVYGDLTPQEIFAKSEFRGPNESDKERYCFTQLKRTTPGGKRFVRTTGGGTWKLQRGENIISRTALKRAFSFKRSNSAPGSSGPEGPDECGWVMYEYSLLDQVQDIALCKIIKKTPSRKRDRSSDEDEEDMSRNGSSKRIRPLEIVNAEDNGVNLSLAASNGDGVYTSNGSCLIPTLEEPTHEGLYGGGVEMMPSTSMIMHHSFPCNDFSFAPEELRDTTMIPFEASNGNDHVYASNEGFYGGGVEMMPSTSSIMHSYPCNDLSFAPVELSDTTMLPRGPIPEVAKEGLYESEDELTLPSTMYAMMSTGTPCDDFSILLEGLLDTSTIPSSTISPNGDGICTRPTSQAANEGLYKGGDEPMPSSSLYGSTSCDDFSLMLEELLDDTGTDDVPSGHGIEDLPQPAKLLEMAEAGEWLKIMNGKG